MTREKFNYILYVFFALMTCLTVFIMATNIISYVNHRAIAFMAMTLPNEYGLIAIGTHSVIAYLFFRITKRQKKLSEVKPWR